MLLVLLFSLVTSFASANPANPNPWIPEVNRKLVLLNGCQVFNLNGEKIKVFPGSFCLFRKNGNVIFAGDTGIRMMSPKKEILWEIPGYFHHQIRYTNNAERILAIGSDTFMRDKVAYRVDRFFVIEAETGKVMHSVRADEVLGNHVEYMNIQTSGVLMGITKAEREISHFNSINEIPEIEATVPKKTYLKHSNIVVNSLGLGTCILSDDLKHVFKCFKIKHSEFHAVHDVTVTPKGRLMYFNNRVITEKGPTLSSAVQIMDIETQKLTYEFSTHPREAFFSPMCGSVQAFGPSLLVISHVHSGTFLVDREKNKLVRYIPYTHMDSERLLPSQEIRMMELSEVLKLWED